MIGLDTNVLLRFILGEDPIQEAAANRYIGAHCTPDAPCFVNRIVLCELVWVLERGYGYERARVADALDHILSARELRVEDQDAARRAIRDYKAGQADFADRLIAHTNRAAGCSVTATFDKKAAKADGVALVGD